MQKRLSGSCWQMHVACHRSSTHFGFQKWSGLIRAPISQWNLTLCGQGFSCDCQRGDAALAMINIFHIISCFFWQLKTYLYICLVQWNVRLDIIHEAMHLKWYTLYKMCSIYDVMHNYRSINWGFRSEDIKFNFMIDSRVDISLIFYCRIF